MPGDQTSRSQEVHRVYDLCVRPIEDAHAGEYVLVTPDGEPIFAPTFEGIVRRAHERASPGNFIFRVGSVTLGRV